MLAFRILYEDEFLLAVDKPPGFHSHPPEDKSIRVHPRWDGLRILCSQLQQQVYPMHRLDRATSGILLVSKDRTWNSKLQQQFQSATVEKTYYALVRGHLQGSAEINLPLKSESGELSPALTRAEELGMFTLPNLLDPKQRARRFTFIRAQPITGRFHQIRRHLAQLALPIIGDNQHGDHKLNREFAEKTELKRMYLRCMALHFQHPATGEAVHIHAGWNKDWQHLFELAGQCILTHSPRVSFSREPLALS